MWNATVSARCLDVNECRLPALAPSRHTLTHIIWQWESVSHTLSSLIHDNRFQFYPTVLHNNNPPFSPWRYRQPRFEHMTQLWHFFAVDQKGTPLCSELLVFPVSQTWINECRQKPDGVRFTQACTVQCSTERGKGAPYCPFRWLCRRRRSSWVTLRLQDALFHKDSV